MKTKSKTTAYIVRSITAAMLLLTAQISLAGSATWLSSPQDSAWENANNWTPGGPPNGPSDIATFAPSSQTSVNISTSQEGNSIVFTSDSASFTLNISPGYPGTGGELIISGTGVINNNSVLQNFVAGEAGQIIFNNTSTAASAQMSIYNYDAGFGVGGQTIFNDTSTGGRATVTNEGDLDAGGQTTFNGSSTADSAIIIANGGIGRGAIVFIGASTGGTARVEVFDNGYLDISHHQSGVTIGSIEGSGNVFLGANTLTVGTRNINTSFSGVISGTGSLVKVGSGVLTLQANDCIADTVALILISGSIIKLDFTGPPDVIASLKVNAVSQPPGIYGGPLSGAPNILPEFAGSGTVSVGPVSILGNISTRAFVQTGDNVVIGGFIVQGTEPKKVII